MSLSRRGLFSAFLKPLQNGGRRAQALSTRAFAPASGDPVGPVSPLVRTDRVAVIQGRHCIAYQQSFCSVCYERCPVPGAIELNEGMPRIALEACTGCGICHEVCPAPVNAILMTQRRPGFGG